MIRRENILTFQERLIYIQVYHKSTKYISKNWENLYTLTSNAFNVHEIWPWLLLTSVCALALMEEENNSLHELMRYIPEHTSEEKDNSSVQTSGEAQLFEQLLSTSSS